MKNRRDRAAACAFALAFTLACGRREPRPEAVPVGRVSCARCGMLVSSERQSAEWVIPGEETLFYDDIGCLATDPRARREGGVGFVHVRGGGWAAAGTVFYARPTDESTPMGYGVVAFPSRAEAAAHDRQGKARTWKELVGELASESPGARGGP